MPTEDEITSIVKSPLTSKRESLLRLFHVIIRDDILSEYSIQHTDDDAYDDNLDDMDSFVSRLDLWNKITELYNDDTFIPKSYFLPTLHRDFLEETDLPPPSKNRPAKMKELFTNFAHCKNQLKSLRAWIFQQHEENSNESGSVAKSNKVKPTILSMLRSANQNEHFAPLFSFPSPILYLWHLDDVFQCLSGGGADLIRMKMLASNPYHMFNNSKNPHRSGDDTVEATPGITEIQMLNLQDPLAKLQEMEQHHSDLTVSLVDMLTQVTRLGGRDQYEKFVKMVDDVSARIDAAYGRCITMETAIALKQKN